MIEETYAYGLVIGCSLFGILWGLVNTLLVSHLNFLLQVIPLLIHVADLILQVRKVDMEDYSHLRG